MIPRAPVSGIEQIPANSQAYGDLEMMWTQSLHSQSSRPVVHPWNQGPSINSNGTSFNNKNNRVYKSFHGAYGSGSNATGKRGQTHPGYVKYSQQPLQVQPPQTHPYQNNNNQYQFQNQNLNQKNLNANSPFMYNSFQSNIGVFTSPPQAESSDTPFADLLRSHPVYNAVFDLRRLGLSFDEILNQSGVKSDILRQIYTMMGYPVPPEVITSAQLPVPIGVPAPVSSPYNTANGSINNPSSMLSSKANLSTDTSSVLSVSSPQFFSSPVSQPPKSISASMQESEISKRDFTPSLALSSQTSSLLPTSSGPPRSQSEMNKYTQRPKRAKFGTTNWVHNLIIDITDDEDSDNESFDSGKDKGSSRPTRPSSAMAADVDATLKAKRDEIKRMTELIAKLKSKKLVVASFNENDNSPSRLLSSQLSLSPTSSSSAPSVSSTPPMVHSGLATCETTPKMISTSIAQNTDTSQLEVKRINTELPTHTTLVSQLLKQFDNLRSDTMKTQLTLKKEKIEHDVLIQRVNELKASLEVEQAKLSQKQLSCDALSLRLKNVSLERDNLQTRITEERAKVKEPPLKSTVCISELVRLEPHKAKSVTDVAKVKDNATETKIGSESVRDESGLAQNSRLNKLQPGMAEPYNFKNHDTISDEVKFSPDIEETNDIISSNNIESEPKTISRHNVDEDEEMIASILSKTNTVVESDVLKFQPPKELIGRVTYVQPKNFTPYKSPLRSFRSFRFSPAYKSTAAPITEYRSLTYSCKTPGINNVLCKYETNGGSCNDETCPQIHFRNFSMSDSEILAELSKAFIGETPEEIQKYRDSFSNELKLLKSTDFDTLADFIVEFRSNYQLKINGRPGQTFSDRFLDWYKFDKIKKRSESKMSSQPNENA